MPGSPRGRGFIPRGGGGGTPPRPPYFPRAALEEEAGEGEPAEARTGGGVLGRSMRSTRREAAPEEHHREVTIGNVSSTVRVHLYKRESDVAPNGFIDCMFTLQVGNA